MLIYENYTFPNCFSEGKYRQIDENLYFAGLVNKVVIRGSMYLIFLDKKKKLVADVETDFVEGELKIG